MATYRELMSKYLKQGLSFSEAAKIAKAEQIPTNVRARKKRARVDAGFKKAKAFYPSIDKFNNDFSQPRTPRTHQDRESIRVVGSVDIKKGKIYYIDYANGNVIEASV